MFKKIKKFFRKNQYFFSYLLVPFIFFLLGFSFAFDSKNRDFKKKVSIFADQKEDSFFKKVKDLVDEKYPFQKPSDMQKMYASLQGLVSSYRDDYTVFLPPDELKILNEDIKGNFGGVGMEVGVRDGFLIVTRTLKNSPAERSGIRAGDVILKVNNEEIAGQYFLDVLSKIRGKEGTEVTFTIFRPENAKTKTVKVKREIIHVPTLETEEISDTFVIHLHSFNDESISLFKNAFQEYTKSGKKYLLIDLRENPGGYLGAAIDILSYFVPQGKVLVYEDYGKGKKKKEIRSKGIPVSFSSVKSKQSKIGVLIDKGSASGSEIFAGGIQDYQKGIILGEKSYGKGSVQELIPFENGSALKVTVAHWLTPKKNQISKKGIEPDVTIKNLSDKSMKEIVSIFEQKIKK